jgi:mannose-6-phosphate isomerase class I
MTTTMADIIYDKSPALEIPGFTAYQGWPQVIDQLLRAIESTHEKPPVVVVDCYCGVLDEELLGELSRGLRPDTVIKMADLMRSEREIEQMIRPYLGDDPVFGRISGIEMKDYFDPAKLSRARDVLRNGSDSLIMIYGPGAGLITDTCGVFIYADMPRWEIQQRSRQGLISNLGCTNFGESPGIQYKRGYFIDWRVCDRHKFDQFERANFFLDTTIPRVPKMVSGSAMRTALRLAASRPFRVVPFFDPAPWGGKWMMEHFDLDRAAPNYGWGFDCVPEENSLQFKFGDVRIEIPANNLVQRHPRQLLGESVFARFGAEFPIRFDMLDTIAGGNLSLQVHPLTGYIQRHFGMQYTQDESYYILDALPEACVYLGLEQGVCPAAFRDELLRAQQGGIPPSVNRYVACWPARRHDHFLIPAGTCHCSGAGAMVLEISATPYIFTFKLWDWGRNGLDGKPRPVHLQRGFDNIQWDRDQPWTRRNLINRITRLGSGSGWQEELTGLHDLEFIETRRHWFTNIVPHHTEGTVNVLNLVQGDAVVVESPVDEFPPMIIHYAETFIVPASVGPYTIRPMAPDPQKPYATIKAAVRHSRQPPTSGLNSVGI